MLGCNSVMNGLGYYTAPSGYYYDASGKAVYQTTSTAEAAQQAAQQNLISQSEQPMYTNNAAQLAAQQAAIAASEQPSGGGVSTGSVAPGARAPGVPLLSFSGGATAGAGASAAGLTPTQQAIAAGYTPTQWAALTPVQQAAALKAAGYGSTSVGPAGSLAATLSNPMVLLVIGAVILVAASSGKK